MGLAKKTVSVLICGGRDFDDYHFFCQALGDFQKVNKVSIDRVTCGAQRSEDERGYFGADWYAIEWALQMQVGFRGYPAEWKKYGKRAGPERNEYMLVDGVEYHYGETQTINWVIFFPGGCGTADMIKQTHEWNNEHDAWYQKIRIWDAENAVEINSGVRS